VTEIRTVTTPRSKRAEIISTIAHYEKRIAQARADLSHVNACIALFARGELMTLCEKVLASGPETTK